jgi:hypothetical protein
MAVSLEDYLKNSKTIQAARKKYTAAQAALAIAQRASQGVPAGATPALRSQVERRLADAQEAFDAVEKALRQEESVQTKFYNTNVNTIQAKADAKEAESDQNRLSDAYAMRDRLAAANQSTASIDRSIKEINDKINKVGKYAPAKPGTGAGKTGTTGDQAVTFRDYATELATAGQAIAKMEDADRLALAQGLKAAGYNVPVSGIYSDALINAYTQAIVDNQTRSTNFNREIPLLEFLDVKKVEFIQGGGAGGGVTQYRTISDPTQAASIIGSVVSNLLGREATPGEVKSLTKILNDAEQKNPGQTVNGKTTGGLDRVQFLVDVVKTGVYSDKKLGKSPVLGKLAEELKTKKADKRALLGEELLATAKANGITLNQAQIDGWTKDIQNGKDINTIKSQIRGSAALGYPDSIKKMIADGTDLDTVYAPYRNRMAAILEVTPDSIDLNDPALRMAIGPDKEMSLYDFQRQLRKDNRWQYTDQAKEEVSGAALRVLQDFGFQG